MRVLITGATGFLGTAMQERVPPGIEPVAMGFSRGERSLDVTDQAAVGRALDRFRPDAVVHLAAVSVTADADADPTRADSVNVAGSLIVARATARRDIRLVALSSDVVFDGRHAPYAEEAPTNPVNAYGASKRAGEAAILAEHPAPLVLRTGVLVGRDRANRRAFSSFILTRAATAAEVHLYENERRNFYPVTSAAAAVWECAGATMTGVLHIGATTSASRFEFGLRLLAAVGLDPGLAVPERGPSDRPSDLTLNVELARSMLATPMPSMEEVIEEVRRDVLVT